MIKHNPKYLVKDNPKLYRDSHSKAIINTDLNALKEHKAKLKMATDVIQNNQRLNKLENDISDIKSMLQALINKK